MLGIAFGLAFAAGAVGVDGGEATDAAGAGDEAETTGLPAFPWGPSIAVACWLCMLFGQQVINWYLGLFL